MAVKNGVAVVEFAHLAQQFQTAVGFVRLIGVEEMEFMNNLIV